MQQTEHEIKSKIIEQAPIIAKILSQGKKDCELRTSPNGISVIAVRKEVISK